MKAGVAHAGVAGGVKAQLAMRRSLAYNLFSNQ